MVHLFINRVHLFNIDPDTQPTLFGRLAQLKKVLVEKLAEVLTKVTGIDGKIGTIGDADTQPTLFGRLAQLKKVLVEKLAEVLTKVTGIDGKIGTIGDAAGTATLFGQLFQIKKDTKDTEMYVLSNTLQKTLLSRELSASDDGATFLGSFYAEKTGLILVEATIKNNGGTRAAVVVPLTTEEMYYNYTKEYLYFGTGNSDTINGLTSMPTQGDTFSAGSYVSPSLDPFNNTTQTAVVFNNSTSYAIRKHAMGVRKGNLYLFFITLAGAGGRTAYCNNLKLYYDVKEVNEI